MPQNVSRDLGFRREEAEHLLVRADPMIEVQKILASLDGPGDPDAEVAWQAEIARRVAALEAGNVKLEPWEDVKWRIEKAILGR